MPSVGKPVIAASLFLTLLNFAGWGYLLRERGLPGVNDYVSFWCGGRLVGTGHLYDIDRYFALNAEAVGTPVIGAHGFTRLPWFALMQKPFSALSYRSAWAAWSVLNAVALLWFLLQFCKGDFWLLLLMPFFLPLYTAFWNGQDTLILMAAVGGVILAMRRGDDYIAGVLLALCTAKYHLFTLVAVALFVERRWRIIACAAATLGGMLLAASVVEGFDWPLRYVELLRHPGVNSSVAYMPNLATVLRVIGVSETLAPAVGFVSGCAIGAAAIARTTTWERRLSVGIAASLLAAPHLFMQDLVLLLPAFALLQGVRDLRIAFGASLLPFTPAFTLYGQPWSAIPALAMLAYIGAAIWKGSSGVALARVRPVRQT